VFVVTDLVTTFRVTDEETKPVSSEMAVGAWNATVCSLTVFCPTELESALPTSMPMLARPVVVLL